MNQTVDIGKKFVHLLNKRGIPVSQAYLFGSYASGRARPYSDIDICIVSPTLGKDMIDEMVKLGLIANQIDNRIEVIPMSPQDYADPFDPLAAEIRRHGLSLL